MKDIKWNDYILTPPGRAIFSDILKNFPHLITDAGNCYCKEHKGEKLDSKSINDTCQKCGEDSQIYLRGEGFFCYSCKGYSKEYIEMLENPSKKD